MQGSHWSEYGCNCIIARYIVVSHQVLPFMDDTCRQKNTLSYVFFYINIFIVVGLSMTYDLYCNRRLTIHIFRILLRVRKAFSICSI